MTDTRVNVSAGRGTGAKLTALVRDAAKLDRTQSDPVISFRNAVGVAAPLVVGVLAGSAAAALPATIGALQTAFADRPAPYRLRLVRMLGTALAASVTSGLAVAFSRNDVASVLLLLVLAFGAGLLLAAGPSATQVGIAGTASALVLGHIPQAPSHAVVVGLLVLAGGTGQTLLALAAWPLGRHLPERAALAVLYHALAGAARTPTGTGAAPQAADPLGAARATLYGLGHDHGPSVEAYRVLLDEAARIRRDTLSLAALVERLRDIDPVTAGLVRAALTATSVVLDEIADALQTARPLHVGALEPARAAVRRASARVADADTLTHRAASARLQALTGQLRAAVESTGLGTAEGRRAEPRELPGAAALRDPLAAVRASVAFDSAVLRHAVRLAVLVAGADAVLRTTTFQHGYWVSLTVLVVMRPDFASTFQRALFRVIGTVVGLLLATALLHWVPGGIWYSIALIAVFFFAMRLAGPGNVGLTAAALSGLIVVLLEINGIAPRETLVDRSVATAIGGALALSATLMLPVWERRLVAGQLADLITAYRRYLDAVADASATAADRQQARTAARRARTNAQASVDRARSEPVAASAEVELGEAVLANSHRVIHAVMTIDSVRDAVHAAVDAPVLGRLLEQAGAALDTCAAALRDGAPPHGVPALRPLQETLHRMLRADPSPAGGADAAAALVDATDRLANGVDTLVDVIRRSGAAHERAVSLPSIP